MRSKMIGPSATLVAGTPEHYDADAGRARVPGDPSTVADHVRDVRLCGVLHLPVIHVYHQAATTQRYAGDMLERVPLRCTATLAVRWRCGTPGAPRSRKARTCFFCTLRHIHSVLRQQGTSCAHFVARRHPAGVVKVHPEIVKSMFAEVAQRRPAWNGKGLLMCTQSPVRPINTDV